MAQIVVIPICGSGWARKYRFPAQNKSCELEGWEEHFLRSLAGNQTLRRLCHGKFEVPYCDVKVIEELDDLGMFPLGEDRPWFM